MKQLDMKFMTRRAELKSITVANWVRSLFVRIYFFYIRFIDFYYYHYTTR